MENIEVLKFGGTSVKSVARIKHVAEVIARRQSAKCLVVVSAMGNTTDHLLSLGLECCNAPDGRELDLLLSSGEQVSIALLCLALQALGVNARSFTGFQIGVYTDDVHKDARILYIDPVRLHRALEQHDVVVVAGFQGTTFDGQITTLGRGGSDISAVALAAAAGSNRCEIYTDVDGVYSSDPNVDPGAKFFEWLCYEDALRLARNGAQVIHPRAVELAMEKSVQLRIRNTFNPDHQGTLVAGADGTIRHREVPTRAPAIRQLVECA